MPEPELTIALDEAGGRYWPADALGGEYRIEGIAPADIRAVELSVLWSTEGKGEEDMSVHYFERIAADDTQPDALAPPRRFRTTLPNSPLSYEGVLLQIRWCVRLRVFTRQGRQFVSERNFDLGHDPIAEVAQP